jgi:hypothetical protein
MVTDAGGAAVEVLETSSFGPVSKTDLDNWINAYKIPVTTVKDAVDGTTATYDALGIRETVFIVDLSNMKILKVINGSIAGIGTSAVGQAIPMILALLANKSG